MSYSTYEARTPEELKTRREKSKAEQGHRARIFRRRATAIGATVVTALSIAGELPQRAHKAIDGAVSASMESNRQKAMTYEGDTQIPGEGDPYRLIFVDSEHPIILQNGNTAIRKLHTVDGIANYIHDKNPKVSFDEAKDYVLAVNSRLQLDHGVSNKDVDPTLLQPHRGIPLPVEWGVGNLVEPEDGKTGLSSPAAGPEHTIDSKP